MLYEERIENHQRQRARQRARHQRPPAIDVAIDELVDDRDRHRLVLGRLQEGQRVDELVPAQRKAEDEGRYQAGDRQRQHDLDQDLPTARAVDQRTFLQFERDGLEVAHQQPGRERDQDGRIGQDQRQRRVEQAVLEHDGGERNEQDRGRHQIGQEDQAADPMRIVALEQQLVDVLEGRIPGPERIELLEVDQLLVRFDRRQAHPVERKQQDEDDDRQRQIKRHQPARQRLQIAHAFAVVVLRDRRRRARQQRFEINGPGG